MGGNRMKTKVLTIPQAAKYFEFPVNKLRQLVDDRKCPFIEQENLSGTISRKINTYSFAMWLDEKARNQEVI